MALISSAAHAGKLSIERIFAAPDLAVTPHGSLRVPRGTFTTTLDGVFAGGDIVRGASLVVWAVRDGRDAVDAITTYLEAKAPTLAAAE